MKRHAGSITARRGRITLLSLLACGAFVGSAASAAEAANPSILNTGGGCSGQTSWLVSCATSGETENNGHILRIGTWLSHDTDVSIASLLTDDDWDGTVDPTTVRGVSPERPSIFGGYPRSRVNLSYTIPTSNTGMSCPIIGTRTRRTDNRNARIQGRDNNTPTAQTSSTSSSIIKFVAAGQCNGSEDFAYLYSWGGSNFTNATSLNPGETKTFTYTGDDKDISGDSDFNGVLWRTRNLRTGAVSGTTLDCDNNGDNAQKSTTVTFPDRGAFVVEAELRDGSGCGQQQNNGYWFPLGTADVNSQNAPTLTLDSATTTAAGVVRPQWQQDWTVRAQGLVDDDAGDGGGAQIVEWDVDSNNGNGVDGYEASDIAAYAATLPAGTSQGVDSSPQSPGLYTVRARVTDNGAGDAADSIRRRSGNVSLQYRVDAAPTADAQTITTNTNATNVPITLTGSDPDGDGLTYSITDSPDHGSLGGSGASRPYTPTPGYAGGDSFTFQVDDGFGRTASAVVTINVRPDTTIDVTPGDPSSDTTPTFEFSSDGSPVAFECAVDSGSFGPCSSPHTTATLGAGAHTFQVQAKANPGGQLDPSPASYSWDIDLDPPDVSINTFPDDPTNVTSASFSFTADEAGTTFECQLDGGGFTGCTSAQVYPGPLSEGSHTFVVRGTDPAGNTSTPASHTWEIDVTAPETAIDDNPANPTNQAMADFEFSSEAGASFQCRLDSSLPAAWGACASPEHYAGLTHGSHSFEVRATDLAGNTDATPATFTWNVDLQNPNTAIDDDTAPGHAHPHHRTPDNNASLDFFSGDGTATFECRLDSSLEADFEPCTTPKLYAALSDGPHTFQVRAKDPAGNVDPTPATWNWEIYNGLPDTILDNYPADPSNTDDPTFTFHGTIPDSTFECSLDGAPLAPCTSPQSYTDLSETVHTFSVVATDEFGRPDPSPLVYQWRIDVTDPETTISAAPDDPSASNSALFQFESNEGSSTFECRLDSSDPGDWAACGETLPQEYTGLADGEHTFEVRAIDEAGNVDGSPASHTWTVDTLAPNTNITSQPADPSNVNNPSFEFESTELGSSFECRLDSALESDWEACTTGLQYDDLTEGSHTFEVRATDEAGNVDGSPASYTWWVDLSAPETTITDGPDEPTNETLATLTFEGSDTHSDAADLSFQCRIDSSEESAWQSCSSPGAFSGLTEGEHTVEVRATDEAGNTDPVPASYTWNIDLTAAAVTIDSGPDDPTSSSDASLVFSSEAGATFECRIDSSVEGDFDPCPSPKDYSGIGEGSHVFEVRATDTAGNTGSVDTHTWTVDQTAPETTIDVSPSDPSNDTDPSFEFESSEANSSFECDLDGGGFEPCGTPKDYTGLGDGSHTFQVRATDESGNADASPASYTWTVDTAGPDVTIDSTPSDPTNSTGADFEFSSEAGASFECELDDGGFGPCASPRSYSGPLAEGEHTFRVRATDTAGNTGIVEEYTWEVDLTNPETTIDDAPADPSNNAGPSFQFSSDESGSSFECELDDGGFGTCSSPKDYAGLGEGSHTFEVRATDQAGNTDLTPALHTWFVDLSAPETSIDASPPDPSNDTAPSFEFSGTDNHSAAGDLSFECDLDGAGFADCDSPEALSGLSEGPHTFRVRATDETGTTDPVPATYEWTVDTTAPGVSVDTGPVDPASLNAGDLTFTVTGTDVDHVDCQLDLNPVETGCTSPYSYTGLADGPHTFTVTAVDTVGNSNSDDWNWTVDSAAPETSVDSGPASGASSSASFGFSADEDPATFECSLDGSAFGACTPPQAYTGLAVGDHSFEVRATDAAGNTDASPASHDWSVQAAAAQGVLGAGPPVIKRRIRALNVPIEGAFQVATITCRSPSCTVTQKSAKIKIDGKVYDGAISVDVVAKGSADLSKGEIARVVVHFSPVVRNRLASNHVGQLTVRLAAETSAGGASTFKKIKLKAKYLKALFG